MKCVYKSDCQATGEPQPPNTVYICPECLKEVTERALRAWAEHLQKLARHQNN